MINSECVCLCVCCFFWVLFCGYSPRSGLDVSTVNGCMRGVGKTFGTGREVVQLRTPFLSGHYSTVQCPRRTQKTGERKRPGNVRPTWPTSSGLEYFHVYMYKSRPGPWNQCRAVSIFGLDNLDLDLRPLAPTGKEQRYRTSTVNSVVTVQDIIDAREFRV